MAAAAAIAAAAAVSVVAAFFALYALVLPYIGAAGAAAAVAATAALFAVVGALILARRAEGPRRKAAAPPPEASLVEKIIMVARAHPILSVGAAVAAGVYGLKNPEMAAAVMRAFMNKPDQPKS